MSGATTELNLATAVDSDDNADYLTLSLANSLRTVDGLFNNVTGHTHGGAHQGGPITPPAGSITSGMIADGTIATADLANASVTNAKLASDTARASLLVNGGFDVWSRGNGPFASGNQFTGDRWMIGVAAPATLSVSADTTNVDSIGNSKVAAACAVTITTGSANISQRIEDFTQLRGKTITASMRVRTSAGAPRCQIAIAQNGVNNTLGTSHTGDGTWQTLTVTYTVPTNTTSLDLYIIFGASGTYYLDNAMLVVGSQAADYAPLHPADELARCLRYYEVLGESNSNPLLNGYNSAGQAIALACMYHVRKAVTPTVTKNGTWTVSNCGQPSVGTAGLDGVSISVSATATGAVVAYPLGAGQNLTVEANP